MTADRIDQLIKAYRGSLLGDIVPFWTKHSIDREHGGYLTFLDRDGSVTKTDKNVWLQGRMTWMFSHLYNQLEPREDWLELARSGAGFVTEHCFGPDGRMFGEVTQEGEPIGESGNPYGMAFAAMGLAEFARASGEEWPRREAIETFELFLSDLHAREARDAPPDANGRVTRTHGMRMVLLALIPIIDQIDNRAIYRETADRCIEDVFTLFCRPELRVVLEHVGLDGELIDDPFYRWTNPGHAIETAWFIMDEGNRRGDRALALRALPMVEWSLEKGWDQEYGGIFLFGDALDNPPRSPEWEKKYWWPQVECLCASLYAYYLTGDRKWEEWFERIHAYTFSHFPDREYGEWFPHLNRDGTPATFFKGDTMKGPFHVSRALTLCIRLLGMLRVGECP